MQIELFSGLAARPNKRQDAIAKFKQAVLPSKTTHEKVNGLMVQQKDEFRTYDSLEVSVRDYGKFLKENKRYKPLLEANSFDEQIEALAGSGYATDSHYGEKILRIIEGKTFRNLLG